MARKIDIRRILEEKIKGPQTIQSHPIGISKHSIKEVIEKATELGIFTRFLEGKTPYSIAKELMEKGMRTGAGNAKWSTEGVVRILQNEKYCGNAILQKTYKRDLLSKRINNNGEVRKYLVENGHEAIITWESSRWRIRSWKPEERRTGSILQSPYSPRSWSAVTAAFSSDPRSGTPPTSTAAWFGSATTSSRLKRSAPLPISGKML